jgi:hypothetical protein
MTDREAENAQLRRSPSERGVMSEAEKAIWAAAFALRVSAGSGTSGDFARRCAIEADRAVVTFRYAYAMDAGRSREMAVTP